MRAVVQRVSIASVKVNGETTGKIDTGFLVYLGVGLTDDIKSAQYIAEKIANLRIFEDEDGKMNKSILETNGEILLISQFTLMGDCRKGRRPNFTAAQKPKEANELYNYAANCLRQLGIKVEEGVFQAMMEVQSTNMGPVTILLDSEKQF